MAPVTSNFGSLSSEIFQANYAVCVCKWFQNVCMQVPYLLCLYYF